MKNRLLLLLLMAFLAPWAAFAQSEFTIGDDATESTNDSPYGGHFGYQYHVYLYDAADVDFYGTVTSVSFKSLTSYDANETANYTLYMKDVPSTTTLSASTTFAEYTAGLTPVYTSSSMPALAQGWNTTTLTTTFEHQSGNSIMVMARSEGCSVMGYCPKTVYFVYKSDHAWRKLADNTDPGQNVTGDLTGMPVSIKFTYTPAAFSCESPTNLQFVDITKNSAFAMWSGGTENFGYEYKKASETTWHVKCPKNCGYNNNLINLNPGTDYQFRVRSYCSDNNSYSQWVTSSFTTSYDIPFEEDFLSSSIPSNWTKYTGLLSDVMGGTALTPTGNGWYFDNRNNVFDNHAYLNIFGTNCKYWLVTPQVFMENNCQLTFDLALTKYTGTLQPVNPTMQPDDRFVVLASTDGGSTWTILREWNNTGSQYVYDNIPKTGIAVAIDLSDYTTGNLMIAFSGESTVENGDNNLHLDNVSIDYIPPCPNPTGLIVTNVTPFTATVAWDAVEDAEFRPGYALAGTDPILYENHITCSTSLTETTFTDLEPETNYVAFVKRYCDDDDESEFITTTFTTDMACEAPTNFQVTGVTHNNAAVSWEGVSGSFYADWKAEVEEEWHPFNFGNAIGPGVDFNNTLQPSTTYYVRVKTICPEGGTSHYSTVSFTTPCTPITSFPWSENFNSYSAGNFTEPCWINEHITGTGTQVFKVYTTNVGSNSTPKLQLPDMYSGTMTKLVLPFMNLPNSDYQFALDVYRSSNYPTYTTEGIRVFASTNGEIEGATELAFIPRVYSVASGDIPAESAEGWYTYDMPIGMSGYCYIILRGESKYGNPTYMDNFIVEPTPPCHVPTHITLTNVTATGFQVNYTPASSTQDIWFFAWSTENVEPTIYNGFTTNPSTYSTNNLQPETHYYLWVGIECEEDMSYHWANPIEFTTPEACPTPTDVTLTNITSIQATVNWVDYGETHIAFYKAPYLFSDFETGDLSIWTSEGDASWTVGTGDYSVYTGAYSGNYNAKITHSTTGNETWLVSPKLNLDGMTTAHVNFEYINRQWGSDIDELGLYYRINGGEWNELWSTSNAHEDWTYHTVVLTGLADNYQIGFKMTDGYGYGVGLDDIKIVFNDNENEIYISGPVVPYPDQSYTFTGLDPQSTYFVYLMAYCDGTPSHYWTLRTYFTTLPENTKVFVAQGGWNVANSWIPAGAPTLDNDVIIRANAMVTDGVVAYANKIILQGSPTPTLTINDGGQLVANCDVYATINKSITGYGIANENTDNGYYLIATPTTSSISAVNAGLVTVGNNYDLYQWDRTADGEEWKNYKKNPFNLNPQTGYLYANLNDMEISITGTLRNSKTGIVWDPPYDPDHFGWNLYGNPFPCNIHISGRLPYYKLEGNTFVMATGYDPIAPMEGFFLTSEMEHQHRGIERDLPGSGNKSGHLNIKLSQNTSSGSVALDNVLLVFEENEVEGIGKLVFNESNSRIALPHDGKDYGALFATGSGELPVSFQAMSEGNYTLSFVAEGVTFSYLHLIDTLTGEDIDLLYSEPIIAGEAPQSLVPRYTFNGKTGDNTDRFKVVFVTTE